MQAFLDINGTKTNVLAVGRGVEESPKPGDPEDIILVIPGNPGIVGFYKLFLHILNEKTGLPVWIVGHAGHEIPKNNRIQPIQPLKGNEGLFNLKGQVEHKLQFIRKYVPENARLHLIGHSIGSYIVLELMKRKEVNKKVIDANLLFPTIEEMARSSNGKFLSRFVKPFVWLLVFLSLIFTFLPSILQNFLVYGYMKIVGMPKMHGRSILQLVQPSVLQKIFFMAFNELDLVKSRDDDVIKQNIGKVRLLYGKCDGWAPKSYCDRLKNDIPEVNAECSDFNHAFVLKQSREVGLAVGDWIKT